MQAITDFLYMIDDFMWGSWMTILILATGVILSICFKFRYQRKIAFNFRNTFAKMRSRGEGEGTVSGFRAACTALANTVGTGNISGVATAIVSGGPGALVWMWISAFFGMSTKACEIIIGQRYREHYKESMNEYVCDRSFVLKNAFGWKKGAVVLAVFCFMFGPWTCCVQTEAVTSSMKEAFGLPSIVTVILIGATCLFTIWGGLKRISEVMSKAVPIMAVMYILMGLGVIIINITDKKIKEAIKVAQAEEFVTKMDKKYETNIAQGGTNISGGQKQRLAIARAIARDPEIYIFDDSFSALDYKTDSILRKELKKYTKDSTSLIVAQRIGTIMNADKIIVLNEGKCVGIGKHKDLLKTCEVYKQIALSQLSKEELENA